MSKTVAISKPNLSESEIKVLRRYLTESHLFSGREWRKLRKAVDKLANCTVQFGTQRYRFAQFYRAFINGTYAHPFLAELTKLSDVEGEGLKRQAQVARQIWEWLRLNGILPGQVPYAEYLVIFCLYWWGAFARGYIFEVAVLRDLQRFGIQVKPHDPNTERFTRYDLYIPGLGYGDVKTSGYFLDDLTTTEPAADFYITRLYAPKLRQYQRIVFVARYVWHRFLDQKDQETVVTSLSQAADRFPQISMVQIGHLAWIVIEYEQWKQILLEQQGESEQ